MAQLSIRPQAAQAQLGPRIFYSIVEGRWIGRWIMAVASIHMILTPILFTAQISEIIDLDVLKTGILEHDLGKVVWFFMYSFPLLVVGHMIDRDEKRGDFSPYQETMISMLTLMTLLALILIPMSGYWMMIPALIGLIAKNKIANERY